MTETENEAYKQVDEYVAKFEAAMEDDFNTADAISSIFELVKFANVNVTEASTKAFRTESFK